MNPNDVKALLEGALPDCQFQVETEGGLFNIVAIGDIFEGKRQYKDNSRFMLPYKSRFPLVRFMPSI